MQLFVNVYFRVRWNRTDGIRVDDASVVRDNTAYQNDGDGIFAGAGSAVQRNTVRGNGPYEARLRSDVIWRHASGFLRTIGGVNAQLGQTDSNTATFLMRTRRGTALR